MCIRDSARATGKVGVCLATSGPGATNLVTGIATAYMDSVPVVAITCNVTNNLLGKDSFQEVDITGVTMPITKYNFIVKDVNKLAKVIRRAFTIAQTGRPGPVLVDITKDVTGATCDYEYQAPEEIVRQSDTITEEAMDRAVEMIRKAQKPFIFVGGGAVIANASDELRAFAHKIQAPVADSLMGKGAFDGTDELYTGMVGMHGTKTSNFGITEADLLIVVGARFSDRVTGNASKFAKNAKILQLDVDPAEINKNIRVDASIIGDVKVILRKLNARLDPVNHDEWIAHIERMKDMYPLRYDKRLLTGPYIVQAIDEVTDEDTIIVTEVGQHQMWAAQYYNYRKPRTLLTSGGLGTMGYGLGAAIGAKMGCKDRTVINIAGDGCFRMNMNEIATAVRYNICLLYTSDVYKRHSYNCSEKLTKSANYYVKVKAYNKVDSSIEGEWAESNTMYVDANMASYFKDNPVENPEGVYPYSSWKQAEDGRWWYDNGDGTYPSSNWQEIGGKWYFFDAEGYMVTGWIDWEGTPGNS